MRIFPGRDDRFTRFDFLILMLSLVLLTLPGAADAGAPWESKHGSLWVRSGAGSDYVETLTLDTEVNMSVSGAILRATVRQRFHNPMQHWVEGIYVFPLPEQAAVDHMRLRIGEQVIEGQVREKAAAQKAYRKARNNGQRASLLTQIRPNVFTTAVANIAPGEAVVVEIEYQQTLDYADGRYSLRFPMAMTPRYTPSATLAKADFEPVQITLKETNEMPENPVSINIDLNAGFPVSEVTSPSHAIDVQPFAEDRYHVSLSGAGAQADRDFRLSWMLQATAEPMVRVFREDVGGESYGLLMVMPPQPEAGSLLAMPRELVLVLDVSGSMEGESLQQARAAVLMALDRLRPTDRFNIIWFSDKAWSLFPQSRAASPRDVQLARQAVTRQGTVGGTQMLSAVRLALSGIADPERLRQVVFITDGAVSNEAELFSAIDENLGASRLFTIGIGSAPNGYFMRKAARAGRGTFTYIGNPGEVDAAMRQLFGKLEAPALKDLQLGLGGSDAMLLPNPLPDLYLGEPVLVSFKGKSFPDAAELGGRFSGAAWKISVPLNTAIDAPGIAVDWARRRIGVAMEQYRDAGTESARNRVREEIVDVALEHHLVSRFTSLVAVDVTPVRAGALVQTQRIRSNRPRGWVGTGRPSGNSLQLAQTATPATLRFVSGLFLLALAALLYRVRRRIS